MRHNRIPRRVLLERYRIVARTLQEKAYETYADNISVATYGPGYTVAEMIRSFGAEAMS